MIEANLAAIEDMLCGVECDTVVLSEMFQTGFVTDPSIVADSGATLEWMQRLSIIAFYLAIHSCNHTI